MPPRVFLGLTEVAGYFGSLRHGFEEAGIPATFIDESGDPFSYGLASRPLPLLNRAVLSVHRQLGARGVGPFRRTGLQVAAMLLRPINVAYRLSLLTWAIARFDVFIFGGEQSFLRGHWDLALLRRFGKRVVWVFTGTDHRPPYLSGRLVRQSRALGGTAWLAALTSRTATRVAAIEEHALVVGHVASAQFHRRPFISFLSIGLPVWRAFPPPMPHAADRRLVRVLHSPSDPQSKGTSRIRDAIGRLQERGLPIEYREILGRPNAEVLTAIADCDIVVDELFGDTPMAVLACEAAHLERPTIVGGYFAAAMDAVDASARPPTAFVPPDALEDALAALVADATERRRLGSAARRFIEGPWAPAEVARRLMAVAEGKAAPEWVVDPATLSYVHGWGMSEAELAGTVAEYLRQEGREALHLDHHPNLVARIVALAKTAGGSDAVRLSG